MEVYLNDEKTHVDLQTLFDILLGLKPSVIFVK